jgi:ATP-dependent DNA helicase RecG
MSRSVNQALARLLAQGEGRAIEFKRSTGELREGMQTVCAFLNGSGGTLLFGVRADGKPEGQAVSDQTLRDITQSFDRFEPPVNVPVERLPLKSGREILMLRVDGTSDSIPFTFEGRPYERVGSTTRKMSQQSYEKLLLERTHSRRRWENQPAVGVQLKDLDREEILRIRELAIQQRRISAGTNRKVPDIIDRLGLRQDGVLTQAAQVLFGKKFLPDYPQCMLKMGRFRGTAVTGEIVDNRQEHVNAFAMVREGMAFLERTLPLGARFPAGTIFREDRLPVPPEALREILLNAVMHRDYSDPGSYVAIAVFDDRVEIRSYGRLPAGVSVEQLSGVHLSRLRNPLIAETFHRTGAVEIWGRGTNRVIAECKRYGAAAPVFEERQGFVIVTFKAPIAGAPRVTVQPGSQLESQPESRPDSRPESLEERVRLLLQHGALSKAEIAARLGHRDVSGQLNKVIRRLVRQGFLQYTLPDKPNSRLQRYRLTRAGKARLAAMTHKG